ncbi:hypothetical protein C4577_02980 [Candidatus Parcubacteria bacterium]|nr:MAG: hypothetical protein C4577_02980 [Candidatus Parcubacteria bacterium]
MFAYNVYLESGNEPIGCVHANTAVGAAMLSVFYYPDAAYVILFDGSPMRIDLLVKYFGVNQSL